MVLPIQGSSIRLQNVELEYGGSHPISLSEYYGQGEAPASGTISLSDFLQPTGTTKPPATSGALFELDTSNPSSWGGSGSTWNDISGNNRDFTNYTTYNTSGSLSSGSNNGVDYNGTSNYSAIADNTWIPDGNTAFTAEFYVYVHDLTYGSYNTNRRYFMSKTSPSNEAMSFGLEQTSSGSTGSVSMVGGSSDTSYQYHTLGTANQITNGYHHFVYSWDGSSVWKMYFDGTLVYTGTVYAMRANSAELRLMCFDPSNGNWGAWVDGEMGVARLYNSQLTDAQVTANYNNCTTSGPITPVDSVLTVSPSAYGSSPFTVTFNFDVPVADFTSSDVSVSNATKGSLVEVSKSQYTMALTTSGNATVSLSVPTTATFNAGNMGNNAISMSIPYATWPSSDVVTYYDFITNPISGTTATNLGTGGTNGVISGSNWTSTSNAVDFASHSGSGTGITCPDMTQSRLNGDFTMAMWVNLDHVNSGTWNGPDDIWGNAGQGSTDKALQFGTRYNSVYMAFYNNDWIASTPPTMVTGTWYFVVHRLEFSSRILTSWIDNTKVQTVTIYAGWNIGTSPFVLAGNTIGTTGNCIDGRISRFMYWDRTLSDAEVTSIYNAQVSDY